MKTMLFYRQIQALIESAFKARMMDINKDQFKEIANLSQSILYD